MFEKQKIDAKLDLTVVLKHCVELLIKAMLKCMMTSNEVINMLCVSDEHFLCGGRCDTTMLNVTSESEICSITNTTTTSVRDTNTKSYKLLPTHSS